MKRSGTFLFAIILLVLVIISFMWAIGRTYAATPTGHTLTYTTSKLTWDGNTTVNNDGTAVLNLFSNKYGTRAESVNGDRIIVPSTGTSTEGSQGSDTVKLRNTVDHNVTYPAVAYSINSADAPIKVTFTGKGNPATTYSLPSGVDQTDVIGTYTGTAATNSETEFGINWEWTQSGATQEEIDAKDTALGSKSAADTAEVGIYITVDDEGGKVDPGPKTGDEGRIILYLCLFVLCVFMVIILLKRDKDDTKAV